MKTKLLLIAILIIAIFLRFYQLGINPPSLTWDEAAWGYNAYSLGIDGRDEFGKFLPYQYLESFGDFKPPMYAYLDILPVKLFGLTAFSTRFPSALFGVLTVLATYFLVIRIFYSAKHKSVYGLISSFVLAISPWHIMLSRAAFEANIATFLVVCGVLFFLIGIQEKRWSLIFSAIFFVLSFYTFNSARVAVPLIVISLAILFHRQLWERRKEAVIACIVGLFLLLPIVKFLFSPQASLRFKEVNIFSDVSIIKKSNQDIAYDNNALYSKIIHNRRILYGMEFLKHYFDNLSPSFLFIKGDGNPKFSIQDVGQMYLFELPFFIVGILFLFKKKEGYWFIIPLWLLLAVIPAATARETPHALRTEVALPTFQILVAYGIYQLLFSENIRKNIQRPLLVLSSFFLIISVIYFQRDYYIHYPREYAGEWQYGYKDSITYTTSVAKTFDNIYITDFLGRPYIYYLFYTKTEPNFFRQHAVIQRDPFGFVNVVHFGKYTFNSDVHKNVQSSSRNLFIDISSKIPNSAHILKTFYLLNGNPVLVAYTT